MKERKWTLTEECGGPGSSQVGLGGSRRILEPMQAELQIGLEPAHACEGNRFGGTVRSQGRLDTHL
jgi:hypothetical protein